MTTIYPAMSAIVRFREIVVVISQGKKLLEVLQTLQAFDVHVRINRGGINRGQTERSPNVGCREAGVSPVCPRFSSFRGEISEDKRKLTNDYANDAANR